MYAFYVLLDMSVLDTFFVYRLPFFVFLSEFERLIKKQEPKCTVYIISVYLKLYKWIYKKINLY